MFPVQVLLLMLIGHSPCTTFSWDRWSLDEEEDGPLAVLSHPKRAAGEGPRVHLAGQLSKLSGLGVSAL